MADSRTLQIILDLKDNATKELSKFSDKLEANSKGFSALAIAGGAVFGAVTIGVNNAVKEASDLAESINAVQVVFGEGSKKILEFGKNSDKAIGLTTSAFNQMSTQTGALLQDVGLNTDEVANKTIMLSERASDMASVFNTDVSDAMSAINQALRGETEAIRRYAGDVTDATLQTFALSQGVTKNVTEMTQQEKRLLRVDLIMKQTQVTQGDFANTSDSLANRQRILGATFQNISATLGETFIPIIQKVLDALVPVIEKTTEWIKENPELTRNIIIAIGAISGLLLVIGALGLVLPAIIAGFTLMTGPIGLVILAIGALTTAGIFFITKWKEIKQSFITVWEAIGEVLMVIVDEIKIQIKEMVNWIIDKLNWFIRQANKIASGLETVTGIGFKINEIPKLANGGIVNKPTLAMIGEAGPEAVVPLGKSNGFGNINITVNGDVTGQEIIEKVKNGIMQELNFSTRFAQ